MFMYEVKKFMKLTDFAVGLKNFKITILSHYLKYTLLMRCEIVILMQLPIIYIMLTRIFVVFRFVQFIYLPTS